MLQRNAYKHQNYWAYKRNISCTVQTTAFKSECTLSNKHSRYTGYHICALQLNQYNTKTCTTTDYSNHRHGERGML